MATRIKSVIMSNLGHIREFDPQTSDWTIFIRRMENYFIVNGITDADKKRAILLNALSEEAYKLIYNLSLPNKPEDKDYKNLITLFNDHFKDSESIFAYRYKFYNAVKSTQESSAEWAARVRNLASSCEFESTMLDMLLRDRFVIGFEKGTVQDRLFEEKKDCKFSDVIRIASSKMAARQNTLLEGPVVKVEPSIHHVSHDRKKCHNALPGQQFQNQPSTSGGASAKKKCSVCGRSNHSTNLCRYRDFSCNICKIKGHLAPVCPNKQKKKKNFQNFLEVNDDCFTIFSCNVSNEPYFVKVVIDEKEYSFQLDSGASISAVSENFYLSNFHNYAMISTDKVLHFYNGNEMRPLGIFQVKIIYNDMCNDIDIFVIKNGASPILGRDFMSLFKLKIASVNYYSTTQTSIDEIIKRYDALFSPGLGTFNKGTVTLKLIDEEISPKFFRARPLPYGLRDKVNNEIDRLVEIGILKSVDFSKWATPIVPVIKKDGSVRICGDFKITINPVLEIDQFPLPRIDDLFSRLQGGAIFSKIDLSQAYAQILLDEKSKELVTISTHKGLFQYQRLPYGVACACAKFQKIMESLLQNIEGSVVFLDDILVSGKNEFEHNSRLDKVLSRLQEVGLKVRVDKCDFNKPEVQYLGYIINKDGLHTSQDKIIAIEKAPIPENITQLKSLLGMINYYGKFIPNLATVLSPLYNLLKKDVKFIWSEKCDTAFKKIKDLLSSAPVLTHYNPEYELRLTTDASPYGIGCLISHILPNKVEKPIAYASRTLSAAEKGYSQIEREGLSIIFGLCKFNQYLYNRDFTLVTDNKPLMAIFNPKKGIPQFSANRLRRWAVILSNYRYKIEYVKSENNSADFLSRLPLNINMEDEWKSVDINYFNYFAETKLTAVNFEHVKQHIRFDETLQKIIKYVKYGWPKSSKNTARFKQFYPIRHELSIENNILLWNHRIVIPEGLKKQILSQLHSSHIGVMKMKSIARNHFYWPGINADIENLSNSCKDCSVNKSSPVKNKLIPWKWPDEIFYRIHIDYFGKFLDNYFLIIFDAHTKWIEAFPTKTMSSSFTVKALHSVFSRFGIPKYVMSDNAKYFTSGEFQIFLKRYNITHITSSPFNPQSNGAAEVTVKTVKKSLQNALGTNKNIDISTALNDFLFDYRTSVHSTTGVSPSILMFGRDIRTKFDLLKPPIDDIKERIRKQQVKQIKHFGGKERPTFNINENVIVKDYRTVNKVTWIPAIVKKVLGKCTYIVFVPEINRLWKRHTNQILKSNIVSRLPIHDVCEDAEKDHKKSETSEGGCSTVNKSSTAVDISNSENQGSTSSTSENLERPKRVIKPPDRLTYT